MYTCIYHDVDQIEQSIVKPGIYVHVSSDGGAL